MDLDLAQVRAFVVAAEQLHFGRAAAKLFLTQQALSKRIQRLEQTLGEQLFLRSHHGVQLSEAGRRFLPHARELLATADTATAAINARSTAPPRAAQRTAAHRPRSGARRPPIASRYGVGASAPPGPGAP